MPNCIDDQVEVHTRRCIDGDWVEEWVARSQMCPQGPLDIQAAAPADPARIALAMAEAFGRGFAQGMRGGCK